MEKKNVKIEDFEDKKSVNGKRYTRFKTNEGWMSAFDKPVIEALKAQEGKIVSVSIAVDKEKGWQNIREFHNVVESPQELVLAGIKQEETIKINPEKLRNGQEAMYVSYAKDIFIRLCENRLEENRSYGEIMEQAIALVKKAKAGFE